jgi:hypothetical protein
MTGADTRRILERLVVAVRQIAEPSDERTDPEAIVWESRLSGALHLLATWGGDATSAQVRFIGNLLNEGPGSLDRYRVDPARYGDVADAVNEAIATGTAEFRRLRGTGT